MYQRQKPYKVVFENQAGIAQTFMVAPESESPEQLQKQATELLNENYSGTNLIEVVELAEHEHPYTN